MTQPVSSRALELATIPARIVLIVLIAVVVRMLLHRLIRRLVAGAAQGSVPDLLRLSDRARGRLVEAAPILSERRRQRAEAIGSVLRSVATVVVATVATAMILDELRFNLSPVLASAGILGVAFALGAQNLVKDFLSGMFMILEDQYGVGDVIDIGAATGTVEAVGLRTTRLRDVEGTVWHIRNGEVLRVGNQSQGWARALLDLPVGWDTDLARLRTVVKDTADQLCGDPAWSATVLDEPELWVEQLAASGLVLRLAVKTAPLEQGTVARELRERLAVALVAAGIPLGDGPAEPETPAQPGPPAPA